MTRPAAPDRSPGRMSGRLPGQTSGRSPDATSGCRSTTTPTARDRFARRLGSGRRRAWRRLLVLVLAATLLATGGWAVWFSSLLTADYVDVTGLSAEDLGPARDAVQIPPDTPLARVDTEGIARRVLENPAVKSVSVQRSWPRTVVVDGDSRQPYLSVRNAEGEVQVVDDDGIPFRVVPSQPPGIPRVSIAGGSPSRESFRAVIAALKALPDELRDQVDDATVGGANSVSFAIGRVRVVWGGAGNGEKKVAVLRALLPTKPNVIDVSAPDTPVTR